MAEFFLLLCMFGSVPIIGVVVVAVYDFLAS